MNQTCIDCKFCLPWPDPATGQGHCHINPPGVALAPPKPDDPDQMLRVIVPTPWPIVQLMVDFCGGFEEELVKKANLGELRKLGGPDKKKIIQ